MPQRPETLARPEAGAAGLHRAGLAGGDRTLLDGFVAMALEAGAAILDIYRQQTLQAASKRDGSPVTQADRVGEAIILAALDRLLPGLPVVAEEAVSAGVVPATADEFILVDALDGTREFIDGRAEFTINIALIRRGYPAAGVVYAPALGMLYAGIETGGAWRADVADGAASGWTRVSAAGLDGDDARAALRVVASRSHMSDETRDYLRQFEVAGLVPGGSSLKFCRVAAGEADLYPRLGRTMEWDTAAGDAVLRAAGGRVSTLDGLALRYGKRCQSADADFANPWFVAHGAFDLDACRVCEAAASPDPEAVT